MNIYAETISGYLQKKSGASWANCLLQVPTEWAGGDLYLGKRYWTTAKPPTQNWALWRPFLSFDTSGLAGKTIKSAWLVFRVKTLGVGFGGSAQVWSQGTTPWGALLEPGDWDKCNQTEGVLAATGMSGEVWKSIDPDSINKSGQTQFRLRIADETLAPTGDEYVVLYGADDADRRPRLVIDTGNVYDDVCTNLAQVLDAHKAELEAVTVHSDMPETAEVDHVYVGWAGGAEDDEEQITVDVYWIGGCMDQTGGVSPSLDRAARIKADVLRRIIRFDANCGGSLNNGNGYCTGIESLTAEGGTGATVIPWRNDDLLLGCVLRVTYSRPGGLGTDVRPVV
jgi:hypothetical protein